VREKVKVKRHPKPGRWWVIFLKAWNAEWGLAPGACARRMGDAEVRADGVRGVNERPNAAGRPPLNLKKGRYEPA